ncbi:hypothetical protein F4824DRAFT_449299 [Ustulina deusta]|nr:hypothetical protein F4824DRAFT_449299 [Ustulina deusta]
MHTMIPATLVLLLRAAKARLVVDAADCRGHRFRLSSAHGSGTSSAGPESSIRPTTRERTSIGTVEPTLSLVLSLVLHKSSTSVGGTGPRPESPSQAAEVHWLLES